MRYADQVRALDVQAHPQHQDLLCCQRHAAWATPKRCMCDHLEIVSRGIDFALPRSFLGGDNDDRTDLVTQGAR